MKTGNEKPNFKINFHIIMLAIILLAFLIIAFKLLTWSSRVREDNEAELDSSKNFDTEALDMIIPLDSSDNSKKEKDDDLHILFLGNGSLAEGKNSETNMANIVQAKTGATVYNCAIPGSFVTTYNKHYKNNFPQDAFSFYYLSTLFTINNTETISWAENDLDGFDSNTRQALNTLQNIDYSKIDVLCIYYDASDYLDQRELRSDEGNTDPFLFEGALRSGILLIQDAFPHIRIIVMSPTYAYAVDEHGNYSSSFSTDILETPLKDYVIMEQVACEGCHVSFVDNFYGTIYEEIADDYLTDNVLLNEKGNELVADRFLYALNRFNDYDF